RFAAIPPQSSRPNARRAKTAGKRAASGAPLAQLDPHGPGVALFMDVTLVPGGKRPCFAAARCWSTAGDGNLDAFNESAELTRAHGCACSRVRARRPRYRTADEAPRTRSHETRKKRGNRARFRVE